MKLFCHILSKIDEPVDAVYLWSPIIDPAYKGFSTIVTRELFEWTPGTETEYRTELFNYIKKDTVVVGVKDHLTSHNFNPWHDNIPHMAEYLRDFLDFYKDKRVILLTSVENLKAYLPDANIVCWSGDLTNQIKEYPTVDPVLDKNLDSDKIFISLNRNPRWHRAMLVSLLHGLSVEQNGIISCMFQDKLKDLFGDSQWAFTEEQQPVKDVIAAGFEKLLNAPNIIQDDYEIYYTFFHNDNVSNFKHRLLPYYKNVFVEIVTETSYTEKAYLLTEKTLNTFYACNFPIILTSPGAVALLRDIGFDMFDDIIDHSYDSIENPIDRMYCAITSNLRLLTDAEYVKTQWVNCRDRFIKNVSVAKTDIYKYYRDRATKQFLEIFYDN